MRRVIGCIVSLFLLPVLAFGAAELKLKDGYYVYYSSGVAKGKVKPKDFFSFKPQPLFEVTGRIPDGKYTVVLDPKKKHNRAVIPILKNAVTGTFLKYNEDNQLIGEISIVNNYLNGIMKMHYDNGRLQLEAEFPNGSFRSYYQSGAIESSCTVKELVRDGFYVEYSEDGSLQTEGVFVAGNGITRTYDKNGNIVMEASYENDNLNGNTTSYFDNGSINLIRAYRNGGRDGIEKEFSREGILIADRHYRDGMPSGIQKEYYDSGKIKSEKNYRGIFPIGSQKEYYENGNVQAEYTYGKPNEYAGDYREYYNNGKLKKTITYNDEGKPFGMAVEYYNDGTERNLKTYDGKGKMTSQTNGYPNGNVEWTVSYNAKGQREGEYREYHENGQLQILANMVNGEVEGIEKQYYESGNIHFEINKVHGKDHGLTKIYADGYSVTPIYIDTYKNGQLVNRKKYSLDGKLEFNQDYPTEVPEEPRGDRKK